MSLLELMRAELKASMALNKPHDDPDKWFEAFDTWFYAKRDKEHAQNKPRAPPRMRAEDMMDMKPENTKQQKGRAERKMERKEEVKALEAEIKARTGIEDLDYGPLSQASAGVDNSKAYEMKRRLAMKEEGNAVENNWDSIHLCRRLTLRAV
ncbi:hypothetical protein HBI56_036470 [Parastagonospora nodorum]|nr:hypothetical protein HBH53_016580 [Parastagonospora nodorum]KAH3988323.1 hypothetical protein HBH51_001350 [Parastagonospora nodorum]KAH4004554.1 hypothetical protein HBI10_039850 [Parastagonospora nodorum]KAH4030667.1 hypothetical protein HBI13_023300 [Parastagonospora nodorum]KAH4040602.1 hypothetical protein HBI09_030080 [Parastagonospora nodorum]